MIVTVVTVRVVQMAIYQIIHMITMRNGLMTTTRPMFMFGGMSAAVVLGRALGRIGRVNREYMFVDVIAMHMMQMTVMEVVHMVVMFDRGMPAASLVFVFMVRMLFTTRHNDSPAKNAVDDGVKNYSRHVNKRFKASLSGRAKNTHGATLLITSGVR